MIDKAEEYLPERFQTDLGKNLLLVLISLVIVTGAVGFKNMMTPEERMEVGLVEIKTNCYGINAGVCLGLQKRQQVTYNYDNYTEAEPGDPNFYRRVESELMAQAYNICEASDIKNYEWTSKAEYKNKTGSEWREMDQVELLPCEETYFRDLTAEK